MSNRSLSEMKRRGIEVYADLKSTDRTKSVSAGTALCAEAREYGLGIRDFLTLAVDPSLSEDQRIKSAAGEMNGWEAALTYFDVPVTDDHAHGVTLQLAADTFSQFPGVRAMFPEAIDEVLRWKYRQTAFENTESIVSQSRTINSTEMISTVVEDKEADYEFASAIAEGAEVPVHKISASEHAVKIYKFGMGLEFTYEFSRRASLDIFTPYQARIERAIETSKVMAATALMINGDGNVAGAAPVVTQSSLNGGVVGTATNGVLSYRHLTKWLIDRARAGAPVDTVVGNWDAYMQWLALFALPQVGTGKFIEGNHSEAEAVAKAGFQLGGVPILQGTVNFALSSAVPDGSLLGITKAETCEELVEAGADIDESERAITNQSVKFVRTRSSGYKLLFADTRSILDFNS